MSAARFGGQGLQKLDTVMTQLLHETGSYLSAMWDSSSNIAGDIAGQAISPAISLGDGDITSYITEAVL